MRRAVLPLLAGAAGGLLLAVGASFLVRSAVERQALERIRVDLERIARDAAALPAQAPRQAFVVAVSRWLGGRVTWIAADGAVLADSDVDPARLASVENHARRPEVLAAQGSGFGQSHRVSATTREGLLYAARTLTLPGEREGARSVVRVALPEAEMGRAIEPYRNDLLVLGLGGGLLAGGAVVAVRRKRDREVSSLAAAVEAVARGGGAPQGPMEEDLEAIRLRLADVARRAAAAERGDEGVRLLSRVVFEELPEALLVVDASLRVLDANPAALRLFGLESIPAQAGLLDVVRSVAIRKAFEDALQGGRPENVATILLAENGADRTLEVTVRPVPGSRAAGTAAAVGLVRDVSHREKTEAMRRQFVADVSHELRTPIAGIRAAAETAATEPDIPEDMERLLGIVRRQARHMEELVSDLTDLSLIETGAVTLTIERRNLRALLADVLRDLAAPAQARDVSVDLDVAGDLTVDGDARRLAQVFRNLVDNAIKFSNPKGRVVVSGRQGPAGETVVSVTDFGRGIPKGDRDRIFQRFYRVDPSRAKSVPGTGLGLAIVKHLLILQAGAVTVDSEVGRGSTFTVTLPAKLSPDAAEDAGDGGSANDGEPSGIAALPT